MRAMPGAPARVGQLRRLRRRLRCAPGASLAGSSAAHAGVPVHALTLGRPCRRRPHRTWGRPYGARRECRRSPADQAALPQPRPAPRPLPGPGRRPAGAYACLKCRFFDDDLAKQPYHCDECGICRIGGRDNYFHCSTCGSCYSMALKVRGQGRGGGRLVLQGRAGACGMAPVRPGVRERVAGLRLAQPRPPCVRECRCGLGRPPVTQQWLACMPGGRLPGFPPWPPPCPGPTPAAVPPSPPRPAEQPPVRGARDAPELPHLLRVPV